MALHGTRNEGALDGELWYIFKRISVKGCQWDAAGVLRKREFPCIWCDNASVSARYYDSHFLIDNIWRQESRLCQWSWKIGPFEVTSLSLFHERRLMLAHFHGCAPMFPLNLVKVNCNYRSERASKDSMATNTRNNWKINVTQPSKKSKDKLVVKRSADQWHAGSLKTCNHEGAG